MNISYQLYQAERTRSATEQREIDVSAGQLAAAIAGLGRAGRRAVTRHQGTGRAGTKRSGPARHVGDRRMRHPLSPVTTSGRQAGDHLAGSPAHWSASMKNSATTIGKAP